MDKYDPYLMKYIGAFVRCNFPHFSLDQTSPSRSEHYALIVGARWDEDLETRIFTLVHSSIELEAVAREKSYPDDSSFKSVVKELTDQSNLTEDEGRVPVSHTTERIVNPQQVVLLPECAEFFHDLQHGKDIEILDKISRHEVRAIREQMKKPPNGVALTFYRMNKEFGHLDEDYLIIEDKIKIAPIGRRRRDRSRKPGV